VIDATGPSCRRPRRGRDPGRPLRAVSSAARSIGSVTVQRVSAALLAALILTAPAALGGNGATPPTKTKAIALVRAVLKTNAQSCGLRVVRITATHAKRQWRVVSITSGRTSGTSRWVIVSGKVRAGNALARRIRDGCPASEPPRPPPAPVEPPLAGPGAPATFTFGPELAPAEQARVRRGLDAGARYYRTVLGRELPPLSVWAYRDLEALLGAYVQNEPISADDARRLWTGGQVGHATLRKVWLGPAWFQNAEPSALKIAAHEAFHLLQYEVVGQGSMSVSTLDEIPPAGPWWLAEGTAEYFAYLAIARDGALRLADVRAQWLRSAKSTSATLRALATLRGQRETPSPYDIYALAVELLLRDRDPTLVFRYYEAVARGTTWPEAFAATFGRSYDAFVDEFEVFRRAA
jgi:hypothetical protein